MRHENVVRSYTSFVVGSTLWLVMPYVGGGSCSDVLKRRGYKGIKDEALIATIVRDVLSGLIYFHDQGYIHRDIKGGNILLANDGRAMLSDFGISGALIEGGIKRLGRRTFTGTPCFMAPEVIEEDRKHDTKIDIWSLGITLFELGFGRPPYTKERPIRVMQLILNSEPPTQKYYAKASHKFGTLFDSFIKNCLQTSPKNRLPAKELIKHPFLNQAKNSEYVLRLDFKSSVQPLKGDHIGSLRTTKKTDCISDATTIMIEEDTCLRPSKTSWIFSGRHSNPSGAKFPQRDNDTALEAIPASPPNSQSSQSPNSTFNSRKMSDLTLAKSKSPSASQ